MRTVDRADRDGAFALAVDVLAGGGVVALPTDTVYGLAARAADAAAVRAVFTLKGRAEDVPIAVLCADAAQAFSLADPAAVGDRVRALAAQHWPGPLTLVLPRAAGLALELGSPQHTIGVRCPDDVFVRDLCTAVGPLATTSANRHGEPPATDAGAIATEFDGSAELELIVDGGPRESGASTVLDVTTEAWTVLRDGPLTIDDLNG